MDKLLEKLSSYNLFNYLLPGVVFVIVAKQFVGLDLTQPDLALAAFLYYFLGMVISRVGSLVVEPVLKKISFITFSDYSKYIAATQKDKTIETLSEANNTYRTIIALFIICLVLKCYLWLAGIFEVLHTHSTLILVLMVSTLFLFSYRKQTSYVYKRIESALKS
jgi:hypothetical protein